MRSILLGTAVVFTGCGINQSPIETTSIDGGASSLSAERVHTRFEKVDLKLSDNAKVVLKNTDYQTERRIEQSFAHLPVDEATPDQDLIARAGQSVKSLHPEMELQLVSLQRGHRFAYATFQQSFRGLEIYGAKITLRLNGEGDWLTSNSTLVNPSLFVDVPTGQLTEIKSSRYLTAPHEVLRQRNVIYPRRDDRGQMKMHLANEIVAFDLNTHQEFWIWVDQIDGRALGAFNPAAHLDGIEVRGTIVPNAPGDTPIEVALPNVTAFLEPGVSIQSSIDGVLDRSKLIKGAKIVLENDYVSVYDNSKASREFIYDPAVSTNSILFDSTPSLEDRNAFYWIMQARKVLTETLKYNGMDYKLGVYTNYGDHLDNAFFMPLTKTLSFGAGGRFLKNTALSRDIVMHEFGHAVTTAIYGVLNNYEFNAMNEAFSDYYAAMITGNPRIADGAMGDKSGMQYLRTLENQFKYPNDFSGVRFHDDGQMFSGALWDIRKTVGAAKFDLMVHEARLAQAKTIGEFLMHLLDIDEKTDDSNPWTPSKHNSAIWSAFYGHGLVSDVSFEPARKENLTMPWKRTGCFTIY